MQSYSNEQLKKNRAAVLLYGGSEADRRAYAVEAAAAFPGEGPLVEAKDAPAIARALMASRGVVYVPDTTALPFATQREVVRTLKEKEERPKLVLGLPVAPDTAADRGVLLDDLKYWLRKALVDVRARPAGRR